MKLFNLFAPFNEVNQKCISLIGRKYCGEFDDETRTS
jgi:hypothetical protein